MYIVFERKDFDTNKFPFAKPLSEATYDSLTDQAKRVAREAGLTHILVDGERLTAVPYADYVIEVPSKGPYVIVVMEDDLVEKIVDLDGNTVPHRAFDPNTMESGMCPVCFAETAYKETKDGEFAHCTECQFDEYLDNGLELILEKEKKL